jgi:CheY-like chemotaxis protein
LTANALANDAPQLENAGFDGFLQKPLRFRELQVLLRRAHGRASIEPASEFDAERWTELDAVTLGDGQTLLERMKQRVIAALPDARSRLLAARDQAELGELGRALHDVRGLLALIGASRAAAVVGRAEDSVAQGELDITAWNEVQQRLDALSAELRGLRKP